MLDAGNMILQLFWYSAVKTHDRVREVLIDKLELRVYLCDGMIGMAVEAADGDVGAGAEGRADLVVDEVVHVVGVVEA